MRSRRCLAKSPEAVLDFKSFCGQVAFLTVGGDVCIVYMSIQKSFKDGFMLSVQSCLDMRMRPTVCFETD